MHAPQTSAGRVYRPRKPGNLGLIVLSVANLTIANVRERTVRAAKKEDKCCLTDGPLAVGPQ
jgi:hypothetical protein